MADAVKIGAMLMHGLTPQCICTPRKAALLLQLSCLCDSIMMEIRVMPAHEAEAKRITSYGLYEDKFPPISVNQRQARANGSLV